MTRSADHDAGIRSIETAMANLATIAPPALRLGVLVETGLADRYASIDSALGPLFVAWNGRGVSVVHGATDAATFETRHRALTGRPGVVADALPERLADAIARRLAGDRRVRIDLDLRGHSPFEQDVWRKALEIPRGEVRPYGWIAAEIGRPRAVRAVGTALGHNPVPLIVPCHRVVRTDGSIGQYSLGGPANKRTILATEGLDPDAMEDAARHGERLVGCASTHVVCWPSCRTGRHMLARNRRPFRSLADARAAGYRPCKVCRPIDGSMAAA
ncbi:MAG: methylated-DNA--[protein]-cysteine S-methyltransferase [Candidatus Limnocylindrales bacterium]